MNKISKAILECFERGGKVICAGNGGSLTQSDHLAEELLGKFEKDRKALPAISLSSPSVISAIANDYNFRYIFSRQLEGLGNVGDLVITISTSGTSLNITALQRKAKSMYIQWIAFPTNSELGTPTYKTQETHLKLIHTICREVENHFL